MFGSQRKEKRGFTLIELLIVVAIIAILAAIAVPNFLEAQVRAKVSRSKADLRSEATAIEAYFIDWNSYPRDQDANFDGQNWASNQAQDMYCNGVIELTTPIAYINTSFTDPFATGQTPPVPGIVPGYYIGSGSWAATTAADASMDYMSATEMMTATGPKAAWVAFGVGPDGKRCRNDYKNFPYMAASDSNEYGSGGPGSQLNSSFNQPCEYVDYDPSNGTTSIGDVYQLGGSWHEGRFLQDDVVIGAETGPGSPAW